MKLHARYVTLSDFDDQYFEVSFGNEHPAADYDPDAPMRRRQPHRDQCPLPGLIP